MLDVSVSVPEPLLSDIQLSESNLLKVTVETAYAVPDVWNQAAAPAAGYVAALQVPLTAEVSFLFDHISLFLVMRFFNIDLVQSMFWICI